MFFSKIFFESKSQFLQTILTITVLFSNSDKMFDESVQEEIIERLEAIEALMQDISAKLRSIEQQLEALTGISANNSSSDE